MLKSKSVAKLIEEQLNQIDNSEKFRVDYEFGGYQGTEINCILKQGDGTVAPVLNYTNVRTSFNIEVILPTQCGEDRVDGILNIVNELIARLNGKMQEIDNGRAIFLFNSLKVGSLETRAMAGQSAILSFSFSVEYANNNNGNKYEIALITNKFEYGTQNVRRFDTRAEQIAWFNNKIDIAPFNEILMPSLNTLQITQRYPNNDNVDLNALAMKNYAIIKETQKSGVEKYYYYYVTNTSVDAYNMLNVDLQMDTLQTFYIDLEFGDCFVENADINRWIDNGDGTVSFDTTINSELFEREDIKSVSKRVVSRDVIKVNSTGVDKLDKWLDENVLGWIYIYFASNPRYEVGAFSSATKAGDVGSGTGIRFKPLRYKYKEMSQDLTGQYLAEGAIYNTIACVSVPVMKTRKRIKLVASNKEIEIGRDGLREFLDSVTGSYVYSMKFSTVVPFYYVNEDTVSFDSSDNLILSARESESGFSSLEVTADNQLTQKVYYKYKVLLLSASGSDWDVECVDMLGGMGVLNVTAQLNINIPLKYQLNDRFTFNKSEIVDANHNIMFNPKLLSSDYKGLVISDNLQNGTEYDILKIGKQDIDILYTEALTPDITKKYIRLANLDGFYIPELAENLTGHVVSDDTSLTLETNQYQAMIANNKNFFLQNSLNRRNESYMADMNTMFSMMNNWSTAVTEVAGGSLKGATTGLIQNELMTASSHIRTKAEINHSQEVSKITEKMSIDNLLNAPSSINGAMGNVIFNTMYSDVGVVVEIHDILPNEKIMIDNNMNMYGMTLNKMVNIKDYDNVRTYHNYIKANLQDIIGDVSNPIRDDIRQRFSEGVRFWNTDDIDYEKENYERWLKA